MGSKEAKRGSQECIETIKEAKRERENETIKGAIDHTLRLHNESPSHSVRGRGGERRDRGRDRGRRRGRGNIMMGQ